MDLSDSRQRFTPIAATYARYRPTYPAALLDWIVATAKGLPSPADAAVVDVGCGTGIASRLFAERGFVVTGVDPNEGMLAEARQADASRNGPPITYQRGEAAATGLAARRFDLAIVAQAFHWFDVPIAVAELRRIIKVGGWCAAFWNLRNATPLMRDYEALLATVPAYEAAPDPEQTLRMIASQPGLLLEPPATFPNAQRFDRDGLLGRAQSSSYVFHGVAEREAFEQKLGAIFDRHQRDGFVEFTYDATCLMWRFA